MRTSIVVILSLLFLFPSLTFAQKSPTQTYEKAKVISVDKSGTQDINGRKNPYQDLTLQIIEGKDKGKQIHLHYGGQMIISENQKVSQGETIILTAITQSNKTTYAITDRYRLPSLILITIIFFAFVILFSGKKGLGSISGLIISLLVIVLFIVPQILQGADPLTTSIIGSLVIMLVTLYLAHGFTSRTTIALVSTFISLILTGILAVVSVHMTKLSGMGTEDAYNLLLGSSKTINLHGLLLGGIIIGALGVLDDTTTTQSTTIAELSEANPSYSMKELFNKGMVIGREHIASLVNTLVLAYAGAAMGIFIFIIITLQTKAQPWWVIFNSEVIAEEVVRTLAGSLGLILAVPITTLIASFFAKNEIKVK